VGEIIVNIGFLPLRPEFDNSLSPMSNQGLKNKKKNEVLN
jgi:hypothetical protein